MSHPEENGAVTDLDFTNETAFLDSLAAIGGVTGDDVNESPEPEPSQPNADAPQAPAPAVTAPGQPNATGTNPPAAPIDWEARLEEERRARSGAQTKMFEVMDEVKSLREELARARAGQQPSPAQPPAAPSDPASALTEGYVNTFNSEFARLSAQYPTADPEDIRARASLNAYALEQQKAVEEQVNRRLSQHPLFEQTRALARERKTAAVREAVASNPALSDPNPSAIKDKTWQNFHDLLRDAGAASGTEYVRQTPDGRIELTDAYYDRIDASAFLSEAFKLALGELRAEEFSGIIANAHAAGKRDAMAGASQARVVATVPVGTAPMPKPVAPAGARKSDADFFAEIAAS